MSDLISRSALVEKLIKRFKDIDRGRYWRNEHMPIYDAIRLDEIENLQSIALDIEPVDAVPVVRCRECKEIEPCVAVNDWYAWCNVWGTVVRLNGFCHRGAKMDGGAEA